jgi:subtilisin family serine protease
VAVLDTGVDWSHPALSPFVWRNPREVANQKDDDGNGYFDDERGWSFPDNTARPMDSNGHGTHCAGSVVLAGCDVMAVKVLGDNNWGREPWIYGGILYAARMGARVISLSLGNYNRVPRIAEAVAWAQKRGCAIVAAAGNDGEDIRTHPIYPACLPGVLSVGALDGAGLWASSNIGAQIHAPGKRIRSTLPGNRWGLYSGTSMACPQVAAAVALVWQKRPAWSVTDVFARLMMTADVVKDVGRALNLQAALRGL